MGGWEVQGKTVSCRDKAGEAQGVGGVVTSARSKRSECMLSIRGQERRAGARTGGVLQRGSKEGTEGAQGQC